MEQMLLDPMYRTKIIQEIKGNENRERLQNSQAEWDVYTGNIRPYVEQKIIDRFSLTLCREVPIVSSVNVLKKLVNSKASIYKNSPTRDFSEVTDEQIEVINLIYNDMRCDFSLLEANKLFELQKKQTHLLIEPINGKLRMRPVKAHQVNVIPDEFNPEVGEIYIFSSYSKILNDNKREIKEQDFVNQKIADYDDSELQNERYVVWSKNFHFLMNGKGEILSEEIESPIAGVCPVVEISAMKDFVYWREETNDIAEFCINFNMHLSLLGQIVEQQGFSQAIIQGPENLLPQSISIGPNRILKLINDPNIPNGDVNFSWATPSADISSAQAYAESLLAMFLSSQGIEATSITGTAQADRFSSGIDRLLSQIEKFEASKETMAIFKEAEKDIYHIIKAWHNASLSQDILDDKYLTTMISEDSEIMVKYSEPSSAITEMERLELAERKVDLGIWTKEKALAFVDEITLEMAEEELQLTTPIIQPIELDQVNEDEENAQTT